MKYVYLLLKILLGLGLLTVVALLACLTPVDSTPYQQMPFYTQTKQRLTELAKPPEAKAQLRAGWAKVSLVPPFTTPTGGYGVRRSKHWSTILDSILVRAIVLDNGATKVAIVSADLLIIPPTVSAILKKRLAEVGFSWNNVYFSAVHSHNSLGGWAPGMIGELFAGDYDERVENFVAEKIIEAIRAAAKNCAAVRVGYTQADASSQVYNRVFDNKKDTDGLIRAIKLQKNTGESALICSFAAHSTVLGAEQWQYLSRDYPGVLVDELEKKTKVFALFMAGAVGGMGPDVIGKGDSARLQNQGKALAQRIEANLPNLQMNNNNTLKILTLPLTLREPHARVWGNWRVRPWLFYAVYGDYPADLKVLRIGNTVLAGTPCDFSGFLVPDFQDIATNKKINLMITSFNGGYVGYITPDRLYNLDNYETQTMNWFGPQNAAYFEELMKGMIDKL